MPILYDIINSLWDKASPYLYIYRETEELEKSPGKDNHDCILEGMKNRDPDKVCRWLEKDISYAAESVLKSMSRAMLSP